MEYRMIAPCYFGAESAAAFDIRRIGAKDVTVTRRARGLYRRRRRAGRRKPAQPLCRAHLLLLKTGRAETFDALFDLAYSVPWEELMPADAAFPVKGSSLSSQLPACGVPKHCEKGCGRAAEKGPPRAGVARKRRGIPHSLFPSQNEAEIMLDTSGEGLHKRGYRRQSTLAPIKETLACAMLDLGRIYPDSTRAGPILRQRHAVH